MGFGCVNSGCELLCKRLCRVRRLQSSTFSLTFSLRSHLRPVRGANETALALRQSFLSYGSSGTRSRSQPLPSHCGGPEHDSQSPVSSLCLSLAHIRLGGSEHYGQHSPAQGGIPRKFRSSWVISPPCVLRKTSFILSIRASERLPDLQWFRTVSPGYPSLASCGRSLK